MIWFLVCTKVHVTNTSTNYPCMMLVLPEVENSWTQWSKKSFPTLTIHKHLCVVCTYTCGHFSIPGIPTGCYSNKHLQGEGHLLNRTMHVYWGAVETTLKTVNAASKQASGVAVSVTLQHQDAVIFYKMAIKYILPDTKMLLLTPNANQKRFLRFWNAGCTFLFVSVMFAYSLICCWPQAIK